MKQTERTWTRLDDVMVHAEKTIIFETMTAKWERQFDVLSLLRFPLEHRVDVLNFRLKIKNFKYRKNKTDFIFSPANQHSFLPTPSATR